MVYLGRRKQTNQSTMTFRVTLQCLCVQHTKQLSFLPTCPLSSDTALEPTQNAQDSAFQ